MSMRTRVLRVVVALVVVAAWTSVPTASGAQSARGTISELEVVSDATGTLTLRWIPPVGSPNDGQVLSDYRISWALEGGKFATWTDLGRNAFLAAPLSEYTITGLDPGSAYKVRMRTRYNRGPSAGARWSGPWVQAAPVAAAPLLSAEQGDDGIIDDSTTERGSADTASANNAAELTTRQGGTNNEPMFTVDGITVDELTWSVPKNAVTGIVGTFAATDDDGDKLEYSVGETTDPDASAHLRAFNEHFALDTESGQITVQLQLGAMFDLGARSSFKVLFQVSDRKNATGASDTVIDDDTLTLTITVTSVDEPPTVPFSVDPRTGTLVKNTDRVGLPSGIDENVLFVFRTGRNSAGYGLSRIGLKMASGSVTSPGPVKITTRGRGHSEGSTVATLEAPALLVASRVNYFTVPAEVTLSADTEYLVSLGNATSVLMTNPGYVNRGSADGWELGRRLRPAVRSGVDQRIPQVAIEGFELSDSPGAG